MLTPREIDVLIAEKIMNEPVEWVDVLDFFGSRKEPYLCESNEGHGCTEEVEAYCTSIAAAWEVVEKMRSQRWRFYLSHPVIDCLCSTDHCRAEYQRGDVAGPAVMAFDQSPPMAICLAALRAVGVSVEAP